MKPINLLSLINAKKDLKPETFDLYIKNYSIRLKESEYQDIESLLNVMDKYYDGINIIDSFFVGYTIKQISKEFDLLRFGKSNIINIELKKRSTEEKIYKQLDKNKYYLGFVKKEILSFTYIVEEDKLYFLNEHNELVDSDFSFLITQLQKQKLDIIKDIDLLFDPTNYLVSPFNSTEDFINTKYFLTDQQENIKKNIISLPAINVPQYYSIQGAAGTGKTLLTYDIAKEYQNRGLGVLIIHTGNLNDGQIILRNSYGWNVIPIKSYTNYNLNDYDLIIIDEVQRIDKKQLDNVIDRINNTNSKCIFSYDKNQCLHKKERRNNIPNYIKEKLSPIHYNLTEKIRTNKEVSSFIKNLFDKNKINPNMKYRNISVQYFSRNRDAVEYLDTLFRRKWKVINYTPPQFGSEYYQRFQNSIYDSAHNVVGQEFDKVVAVIDKHFYYDSSGKLTVGRWSKEPYYDSLSMLFQIVTRTRKELKIVIIKNEPLLISCLRIIDK